MQRREIETPVGSFAVLRLARLAAVLAAAIALAIPLIYQIGLVFRGLRLMDLWGGGQFWFRPAPPGTEVLIARGHAYAMIGEIVAFVALTIGGTLLLVDFLDKRRGKRLAIAVIAAALVGGFMSVRIGFILAGI